MIRRAVLGLALALVVILVALSLLGFRVSDMAALLRQPPMEALEEGKFLDRMVIWIDGETISGRHSFELTLRNPTRRELSVKGSWIDPPRSEDMAQLMEGLENGLPAQDSERFSIDPVGLAETLGPGESKTITVQLDVLERTKDAKALRVSGFRPPVLKGEWSWTQWAPEGRTAERVKSDLARPLLIRRAFGTVNYAVLGVYFAAMLIIGLLASRRVKGTRSFFIADGKLHYIVVGLSILGTYLSALGMMALTGMAYGEHDWTYVVQLPFLVITAMVITGLVLPRYRAAGIVSIYEYLEQRIHVSARLAASISFMVFAVCRMGLLLYLPGLALSTITGMPLWLCIVAMGVIITIYTAAGGIEAVIWTDVLQVAIFVAGAFLALGYVFRDLGVSQFLEIGLDHNKFRLLVPGFDIAKITSLWLVLETIYQTIRIYGTSQDIAQRYMATDSTEHANRSVWIGILGYIPLAFIFFFIGSALFVFYQVHPDFNLPEKADRIFPYFVADRLPVGLAGLVIAAIFAAAMSSIDSLMNSSSTVCVEDFLKRFSKTDRTDQQYLKKARFLTLLWGTLAVLMGLMCMQIEYAQIMWGKLMGISTTGILGLMALAFLPFKVNKWAAMAGFVFAYVCLFVMMGLGINFLLWVVIGNTACFLVALFLNPLFARLEPDA